MNNSDMPAMAVKVVASVSARRQAKGLGVDLDDRQYTGLTKREYMAALALQGLLVDPNLAAPKSEYARNAVELADALLKELDK